MICGVADHKPDVTIDQTVINLLGKAQRMAVAESLFEGTVEGLELGQNEYASLIVGYIRTGSLQRGIAMLEKMKEWVCIHQFLHTLRSLMALQELQQLISLLGPLI